MLITDPIDALLDSDNELVFENGDFVLSTGVEGIAQNLAIELSIAIGEWFENRDEGIPYFDNDLVSEQQALLGGKFSAEKTIESFRKVVADSFGVRDILLLSAQFDTATRKLTVTINVNTLFGETGVLEISSNA